MTYANIQVLWNAAHGLMRSIDGAPQAVIEVGWCGAIEWNGIVVVM